MAPIIPTYGMTVSWQYRRYSSHNMIVQFGGTETPYKMAGTMCVDRRMISEDVHFDLEIRPDPREPYLDWPEPLPDEPDIDRDDNIPEEPQHEDV